MANEQNLPTRTLRPEQPEPDEVSDPARYRGVRVMILGAVVAVLAPLGGFLAGSVIGSTREVANVDARFAWMFAGLVVGGLGVLVLVLGLLRWSHRRRHQPLPDRAVSRV